MALRLSAPAKLNLHLRVRGRRPDGYHELETVFHALDLHDVVTAERTARAGEVELSVHDIAGTGFPVPAGSDNLVYRAGRAFLEQAEVAGGLRFHLRKRIPSGGGLGGGSSDAAQALRLAQALCDEPLAFERLARIALEIGADVPFFLHATTTMIGRGVGERLTPVAIAPRRFLLLLPPFGTSTGEVFKNLEPQLIATVSENSMRQFEADSGGENVLTSLFCNDLENAAFRSYPELGRLRDGVAASGRPDVRLTGSGSTMFLVIAPDEDVQATRAELRPLEEEFGLRLVETRTSTLPTDPESVTWPTDTDVGGNS